SAALAITALLPVSALVVYFAVGAPAAIDPATGTAAAAGRQPPHDRAELSAAADLLKARLQGEPGHKEGWVLLGRTFVSLGRVADAPVDAPWRKVVAERLAQIAGDERENGAAPANMAPTGPTAQDVAAAQTMSPEERQAIIRGMVDRLAARLEQNPNDKEGWI